MKHDGVIGTAEMLARFGKSSPEFARAWNLESPKVALAANVAHLRTSRGLTQKQLAEAAGMKQPRIAEIERGDANPRLETLIRIALALRVEVADLHATATRAPGDAGDAGREAWKGADALTSVAPG
jgi:DNA-binding XRE family transcriptional regulator